MSLVHGPLIVTSSLSLCMDSANPRSYGGTGTLVYDISGNGLRGTLTNGPTYVSGSSGYFQFDGVNDYINIGNTTVANVFTGNFTISAWVYRLTDTGPAYGNIIGDYYTGSVATTGEWQIMMSNGGAFNLYRVGDGYVISNTSNYGANQWHNVVVTRVGSTITMYVDNVSIATATNSNTFGTATGVLNIGIDGNNSSEPLNGRISNVMIYKGLGLSAAQVSQNFTALRGRFGL
jgi:hypothetical protein